jgi:hypothetical protein
MTEASAPPPAEQLRRLSPRQARTLELAIVTISVAALVMLFQPFALGLYSVGAGLVVVAGLAFNLVPLCQPGRPARSLVTATVVIAVIFVVVTLLALGSAELYAIYLTAT